MNQAVGVGQVEGLAHRRQQRQHLARRERSAGEHLLEGRVGIPAHGEIGPARVLADGEHREQGVVLEHGPGAGQPPDPRPRVASDGRLHATTRVAASPSGSTASQISSACPRSAKKFSTT